MHICVSKCHLDWHPSTEPVDKEEPVTAATSGAPTGFPRLEGRHQLQSLPMTQRSPPFLMPSSPHENQALAHWRLEAVAGWQRSGLLWGTKGAVCGAAHHHAVNAATHGPGPATGLPDRACSWAGGPTFLPRSRNCGAHKPVFSSRF